MKTDGKGQAPSLAEAGRRRGEARQERQAKALRDNLLKRKAQQRARAAADTAESAVGSSTAPGAEPHS